MKKGFTLVELIACIALMAMLATIIITVEMKKINEAKEKSKDVLIKSIELAAKSYVSENIDLLNNLKQYDWENISLQTLVENNKLTNNLLDQTTNLVLPLSDIVYVTRSYNGKITATYDINQNTNPSIILNGAYNIYLDLNEAYSDLGVIATSVSGDNITNSVTTTGIVNTTQEGVYILQYEIENIEISRNVIVEK